MLPEPAPAHARTASWRLTTLCHAEDFLIALHSCLAPFLRPVVIIQIRVTRNSTDIVGRVLSGAGPDVSSYHPSVTQHLARRGILWSEFRAWVAAELIEIPLVLSRARLAYTA